MDEFERIRTPSRYYRFAELQRHAEKLKNVARFSVQTIGSFHIALSVPPETSTSVRLAAWKPLRDGGFSIRFPPPSLTTGHAYSVEAPAALRILQ